MPTDMAFIAMSKDAGEILESVVINGSRRIEMIMDVTNDQELTIRVPCGTYYGASSELLIVGGHHDTVITLKVQWMTPQGLRQFLRWLQCSRIHCKGEQTEQSDSVHGEAKKKDCGDQQHTSRNLTKI